MAFIEWGIGFGKAAWSALGWRRAVVMSVLTYVSTYWNWALDRFADYIPVKVYSYLSLIPAAFVASIVATGLAIIFLVIKIMPRAKLEFYPNEQDCVHETSYPDGTRLRIFRIRVTPLGSASAYYSGFLVRVNRSGRNGLTGPIPLTFAPSEDGDAALRKLLPSGIPAHLDVFLADDKGRFILGSKYDPKFGSRIIPVSIKNLFASPDHYEFEIAVTSDNSSAATICLGLEHTGNWKTTNMRRIKMSTDA